MIKRIELRNLKKDMNLHASRQRYHNKNKSGGNFGYDLYPIKTDNYPYPWLDVNGDYDTEGNIRLLSVTYQNIGRTRVRIIGKNWETIPYTELVEKLQTFLKIREEQFP